MKKLAGGFVALTVLLTIVVAYQAAPRQASAVPSDADLNGVVQQYCAGCHSDATKSGNLSLVNFDVAGAPQRAEVAEKMIRKLRAGMMPPPGARRPDADTTLALVTRLETTLDVAWAKNPNPGG